MRMTRTFRLCFLATLVAVLLCASPAGAQVTGAVVGAVKDSSGAVLPARR